MLSNTALHSTAFQSDWVSLWDHIVLPATRHKWPHTALTPAKQAGTRITYHGGMEGSVEPDGWLYT